MMVCHTLVIMSPCYYFTVGDFVHERTSARVSVWLAKHAFCIRSAFGMQYSSKKWIKTYIVGYIIMQVESSHFYSETIGLYAI